MKRFVRGCLMFVLIVEACAASSVCRAQTPPETTPNAGAKPESRQGRRIDPAVLKKYVGRYELEAGLIPVSTLDVTLDNNELWVKPSAVKKRRLLARSQRVFLDEIEGTRYLFNRDEEGAVVSLTFQSEGSEYTARKVALPPPSVRGNTTFKLKGYTEAQVVVVAGTFNNWNESQLLFAREGDEWVCRVDLSAGRYAYKFIVDGNWLLDPANPDTEEDAYGNLNSVLVVEAKQ